MTMKKNLIRFLSPLWQALRKEALGTSMDESVAFVTANVFETPDTVVFLGQRIVPAKRQDYLRRSELHLSVSPLYVSRVLNIAEDSDNTVIMVHSHPFENGRPQYSLTDNHGEALTSETISRSLVNNPPVGSLLFGQKDVVARVWGGLSKQYVQAGLRVLDGTGFMRYGQLPKAALEMNALLDRQRRALSDEAYNRLMNLRVGIVGLGGTGSNVAEQLARMGIQDLVLVDHDRFEPSNWSRLYGSSLADTSKSKFKVDIVASHLKSINPEISCIEVTKSVMSLNTLRLLAGCDVVFSCVDRHAPRAVINELSYQCYIPVVDVGVGLSKSSKGDVLGGSVRATLIGPTLPCLFCNELINPDMIMSEHLTPEEYAKRRAEGYVAPMQQNAPAIVSYTTMAASLGMVLFLDYVSGRASKATSLLWDLESKDFLRLKSSIKHDCVCQKKLGAGFKTAFSVAEA